MAEERRGQTLINSGSLNEISLIFFRLIGRPQGFEMFTRRLHIGVPVNVNSGMDT